MVATSSPSMNEPTSKASSLLQCSAHGQTLQMVRDRWGEIASWSTDDPRGADLTLCFCCTGPAKYPGIDAMTMDEIELITPLCSRCAPKKESGK